MGVLSLSAQNTYIPLGAEEYRLLDRMSLLYAPPSEMHAAIRPFRREDAAKLAWSYLELGVTGKDREGLIRIVRNNNEFLHQVDSSVHTSLRLESERPFLKSFYRTPAHLYELDTESFYLRVNPLIHFGLAREQGDDDPLFVNRRGIEIRGGIDQRVFFATDIIETQARPPSHVRQWVLDNKAYPDAGLFKRYRSSLFDFEGAYDYLNSSGYLGFNISEHVGVHLGHGKNVIGDGYRSLLLSDFAKNYFYLKLNTRVWKIHYQNIFAELSAAERESNIAVFPKKYLAAHYLSFRPRPNLSFGIFEAVVFAREDNRFELQYLNPVILYRTIEQHVGSPDNVLIGLNASWDIKHAVRLYGQIMLDEFKVSEFFSSNQWWGNKFGIQAGVKYPNALQIESLDLQLEYNRVRPFTYSHRDSMGSYAHFNQPLAHPLGANFTEVILGVSYQPLERLHLQTRLFVINTAEDTEDIYYGTSILRPNGTRNADYGVEQGQGVGVDNTILTFLARYRLKHNLFVEGEYFRRSYQSADPSSDLLTQYVSLAVRWNLFYRLQEF